MSAVVDLDELDRQDWQENFRTTQQMIAELPTFCRSRRTMSYRYLKRATNGLDKYNAVRRAGVGTQLQWHKARFLDWVFQRPIA